MRREEPMHLMFRKLPTDDFMKCRFMDYTEAMSMSDSEDRAECMRFLTTAAGRAALAELRRQCSPLLEAISSTQIQRLRQQWGPAYAGALLEQYRLTKGLIAKFGTYDLLATERALQQASDALSAEYKALQIPSNTPIWDWCHGMGGDLRAFAQTHPSVGIDRDIELSIAAQANAPTAEVRCEDVAQQLPPSHAFLHADPDRRVDSHRTSRPEYSSPPLEVLERAIKTVSGACIKLAPAASIPPHWEKGTLREWISVGSSCRQQVIWFGNHEGGIHRAVHLKQGRDPVSFSGSPSVQCDTSATPENWIYDADPAIRASGLSACWGTHHQLKALGSPAGFFTSKELIDVPLGQKFQIIASLPLDDRKLRARCQELKLDIQEVKVRGVDRTPESLRKGLRRASAPTATLLVGRSSRGGYAVIAQRLEGNG